MTGTVSKWYRDLLRSVNDFMDLLGVVSTYPVIFRVVSGPIMLFHAAIWAPTTVRADDVAMIIFKICQINV